MKKIIHIFYLIAGLGISISSLHCKKEKRFSVFLKDKPLETIKTHIAGKWLLQYEKGGLCSSCVSYPKDFYWEFGDNDKVKQIYKGVVATDTTINWVWDKDIFNDSCYRMNFSDKRNYPYSYIVYKINEDTLVLIDAGFDPVSYHLTKSN